MERHKTIAVGTAAAVLAGYLVIHNSLPACERAVAAHGASGIGECISNPFHYTQRPAQADFGNLNVQHEDLTGNVSVQTFGAVTMKIGGSRSTFDYRAMHFLQHLPGSKADATLYWNKDGKQAEEIKYYPCIVGTNDYTKSKSAHKPAMHASFQAPDNAPSAGLKYTIEPDKTPGPNYGKVKDIVIKAGILDTCFMHVDDAQPNKSIWSDDPHDRVNFGDAERATFEWEQEDLITYYALSQACPEKVVDMNAIKAAVAKAAIGGMLDDHQNDKQFQQLITRVYDGGKVIVQIDPPEKRRAYYQQQLNERKQQIASWGQSFPNPQKGNKRYKLAKPKFGSFAVQSCSRTDFQVRKGG